MSDAALITEKANYNAKAGQTIAGNLARGGDGKFTAAGNATASSKKPPQNYGGKRAAANAKLQQRLAARRAAAAKKAKPKGKGGKGKAAAKPKGGVSSAAAARRAEAEKRRQVRAAEAAKRKADRDAAKLKRDQDRTFAAANRDAKKLQREQDRAAAQAKRKADRDARRAEMERRKAERAKGGGGGKGKAAPKAGADKSAEVAANRTKVQAATLDSAAFSALQGMTEGKAPAAGAALDVLVKSGLVERDSAGGYRISQAGRAYTNAAERGDIGRAKDAMSRAADRVARADALRSRRTDPAVRGALQTTKQTDQEKAMFAAMGASGGGSGGGGGSAGGSSGGGKLWPRGKDGKRTAPAGSVGASQIASAKKVAAQAQGAAADGKKLQAAAGAEVRKKTPKPAEDEGKARVRALINERRAPLQKKLDDLNAFERDHLNKDKYTSQIADLQRQISKLKPSASAKRRAQLDRELDIAQKSLAMVDGVKAGMPAQRKAIQDKLDELSEAERKYLGGSATKEHASVEPTSVTVFKQANGVYRWLGVSSTAYQDRDKQYVSLKALQDDVERADLDGNYGPLRFWHMPGVDIGTTDFNAVIGRSLVESGEIPDARIGHALATSKEHWQMSLGFLHSRDQPIGDTFTQIRRFERSILPASAASNPFTSLLVYKGNTMSATIAEKEAKLKELISDPDILGRLLAQVDRTEKAADAAGVRYKEAQPGAEDTADAEAETKAAGDEGGEVAEDEAAEDEAATSILEAADLAAIADAVAAKLAPMFEAMAGATMKQAATVAMPSNLDKILDGFAQVAEQTKEAADQATATAQAASAKAAEAATNAAEVASLKQRIAELEGDQPRGTTGGYRASQASETATNKERTAPAEDEMIKAADWLIS